MGLYANQTIREDDFVNRAESEPLLSDNEGKVPKLEDDGKLSHEFTRASNIIQVEAGEDIALGDAVLLTSNTVTTRSYTSNYRDQNPIMGSGISYRGSVYKTPYYFTSIVITKVQVAIQYWSNGSSGNPTYDMLVYEVDINNIPTGAAVAVSNSAVYNSNHSGVIELTFNDAVIQSNKKYAFVLRKNNPGARQSKMMGDTVSGDDYYGSVFSTDGVTWTSGYNPMYFTMYYKLEPSSLCYKTSATDILNLSGYIGVSISNTLANGIAFIQTRGALQMDNDLTIGGTYYLSNTRGLISETPGTISKAIGRAMSEREIVMNSDTRLGSYSTVPAQNVPVPEDGFLVGWFSHNGSNGSYSASISVDGSTKAYFTSHGGGGINDTQSSSFCVPIQRGSIYQSSASSLSWVPLISGIS